MSNKLVSEKSPYLLQHSENPVDWYPWSDEAFCRAKAENKPVFLSVGYSTCHWCHVMAHESFEDPKIAELLNEFFISVKVDREERPDIDAVYMSVCQAMTGQGGWPMSIFMTPDKLPFFAATYLPPVSRHGVPGFDQVLTQLAEAWKDDSSRLVETGKEIQAFLRKEKRALLKRLPGGVLPKRAYEELSAEFDGLYGGFGGAPKFPMPHNLMFLMRYAETTGEQRAQEMAEKTLEAMYRGGIFDHIGGGFCRYSTDEKWLAPHFEKMLYDNALLVMAYTEAYRITGRDLYKSVVQRTLAYIVRELTGPEGEFYCAQDADSEGQEGKYYLFSKSELEKRFGDTAEQLCRWFGITEQGNFEGKNIPNLIGNSRWFEEPPDTEELREYRGERMRLHTDDKVLTSWNGLMVASYAAAYSVFGQEQYLTAALRAEQFITNRLAGKGRLFVRYRDGEAAGIGMLDDYAFFCCALLELYRVTFDVEFLEKAVIWADVMEKYFLDEENGGFYLYADDAEELLIRPKETWDGAVPSGNSAAAFVLLKLARLTGEERWQKAFDRQMRFLCSAAEQYPAGHALAMLTLQNRMSPLRRLICVEPDNLEKLRYTAADPSVTVLVKTPENTERLSKISPFSKEYPCKGYAQYYLCEEDACRPPVSDLKALKKFL